MINTMLEIYLVGFFYAILILAIIYTATVVRLVVKEILLERRYEKWLRERKDK